MKHFILLVFLSGFLHGKAQVQSMIFAGQDSTDIYKDFFVLPDSGFVCGGYFGTDTLRLTRLDKNGNVIWSARPQDTLSVQYRDFALLADNRIAVCGNLFFESIVMILDSSGNLQDTLLFQSTGWSISAMNIIATPDSGFIFTAYDDGFTCSNSVEVWKFNKNLTSDWRFVEGVCDASMSTASALSTSGRFYYLVNNDYFIGPPLSNVNINWLAPNGTLTDSIYANLQDFYPVIESTRDSGAIVAGIIDSTGSDDIVLIKTDYTGQISWVHTFGQASNETPVKIIQTPDGGYVVFVIQTQVGADVDAWVYKVDSLGNYLWDKNISSSTNDFIADVKDFGTLMAVLVNNAVDPVKRNMITWIDQDGNFLAPYEITATAHFYCMGDTAVLTVNPPAASYLWNTGDTTAQITVTAPGNFFATVTDALGNTYPVPFFEVNYNNYPDTTLSTGDTITICWNGAQNMSLYPDPGTTYQWLLNDSVIPNAIAYQYSADSSGTYSCVVSNACGIDTTGKTYLHVNPEPPVEVFPDNPVYCGEPFIAFTTSPGIYFWNTGSTENYTVVNNSGTLILNLRDTATGCMGYYVRSVALSNAIAVHVDAGSDTVLCQGDSIQLVATGGFADSTMLWSTGTFNDSLPIVHPGIVDTVQYFIVSIDTNQCVSSDSVTVRFDLCTGVDENNEVTFNIYQNGDVFADFGDVSEKEIRVYDLSSRLIYRKILSGNRLEIPSSCFSTGIYVMTVLQDEGTFTKRFFVAGH